MKKRPPPPEVREAAGQLTDAMMEALRREYTAGTSEALLDEKGHHRISKILEGLGAGEDNEPRPAE